MIQQPTAQAQGASGATYPFQVFVWGTQFQPCGAVYLVLRKLPNGNHAILYVGQTGDLSERFECHHKALCFLVQGCTHIGVLAEPWERRRLVIESDLIVKHQPFCNG